MSEDSTDKTKPGEPEVDETVEPDVMPEPDDDQEAPLPEAGAAEAGGDDQEAPKAAQEPVARQNDIARNDIARLYREQRDAEKQAGDEGGQETGEQGADDGPAADVETVEPDDAELAAQQGQDDEFEDELTIDGETKRLSYKEIKALAQMNGAANNRLDAANRIVDELKAMQAASVQQPPADQSGAPNEPPADTAAPPDGSPEAQTNGLDPEVLGDIAYRIQVGNEEEGKQALADFFALVRGGGTQEHGGSLTAEQVAEIIDQRSLHNRYETDFRTALRGFGDKYPGIFKDPDIGQTSISVAARHMRQEMQEKAGLTEEALNQIGMDPKIISATYRQLLMDGHQMKPYDQIFTAVGDEMTKKFNLSHGDQPNPASNRQQPGNQSTTRAPQDPAQVQQRMVRKRSAQQQPKAAGGRQPQPKGPQPKTKLDIIQEMRAARRYPVQQ